MVNKWVSWFIVYVNLLYSILKASSLEYESFLVYLIDFMVICFFLNCFVQKNYCYAVIYVNLIITSYKINYLVVNIGYCMGIVYLLFLSWNWIIYIITTTKFLNEIDLTLFPSCPMQQKNMKTQWSILRTQLLWHS